MDSLVQFLHRLLANSIRVYRPSTDPIKLNYVGYLFSIFSERSKRLKCYSKLDRCSVDDDYGYFTFRTDDFRILWAYRMQYSKQFCNAMKTIQWAQKFRNGDSFMVFEIVLLQFENGVGYRTQWLETNAEYFALWQQTKKRKTKKSNRQRNMTENVRHSTRARIK